MNRIRSAVSGRAVTAAMAVTAAAVTGLVWSTSSSGPSTAPTASAVALADADTVGLVAGDQRPLPGHLSQGLRAPGRLSDDLRGPGRLPEALRDDLRKLRTLEPEPRQEAAAKIWQDALDGRYGTRVELRAEEARRRFRALPRQLQDDIKELRGLSGEERTEQRTEIRDKALSGEYGRQVQRWAERRADFWQQH
ncbi:Lipase chaperone OS=Streptomyces chartreusis OX=1969 GN=CP983_00595 PE=4 SV=1 [Streptomyces chartreusis]